MPTPWTWARLTWCWAKPQPQALALLLAAQVLPQVQVVLPAALPPVPQRVVRTHPGSRRKTLYLAAHASHILGLPVADGRLVILDLIEHATQPRFVHSHRWAKGDLVIWDNRCTMHRARPFDTTKVRDLRRVTTRDVASTLEQAA